MATDVQVAARARPLARWAGPAAITVVFAIYLAWTWGKWPDALVDFGRELYVPWRLCEGQRLYADVAYFNGPLSPSINAVLFRVFGVGLRTLVIANTVVLAAVAMMVHALLRVVCDRLVAAAGTLALLVFFAFAQFLPGGNYNYLAPYSHETTHGTALATAALLLLAVHLRRGGGSWTVFGIGLMLGLVFLTKAEFVIALVPAIALGLVGHHWRAGTPRAELVRLAIWFAGGSLAPPLVALSALLSYLPPGEAWKAMAGSWVYIFDADLARLPFYREIRGTLDLGASFRRIGAWTARYAVALAPAAIAGFAVRRAWRGRVVVTAALAGASVALVLVGRGGRAWEDLATPWPLFLVVAVAVTAVSAAPRPRRLLVLSCLLYALVLLLKMILNTRILHYGFVLAMPAGLALVAILLGGIPAWLDRRGRNGPAFRVVALAVLCSFGFVQLRATHLWLQRRTVPVGTAADRFLIHDRDSVFTELLARVDRLRRPGDTLLVIPEGVMINYLLRMRNPTGHLNFMPPELIMFGEDRMLRAFRSGAPDWIVLVNRGAQEYGYRMFGDDYGRSLVSWVEANYGVVDRLFEPTIRGPEAYAAVLRRNGS